MDSPLIHWHTTWEKNNFSGYAATLDNLQQRIRGNYMADLFRQRVNKVYGNEKTGDAVLRAGDMFSKNKAFQKAFDQMFKQYESMKPFSTYGLRKKSFEANNVKSNIDAIRKYLEGVEKGFNSIATFLGGGDDVKAFYAAIAQKSSVSDLREYFSQLTGDYTIYAERFKELDSSAQGKLRSIAQYFNQIQGLSQKTSVDIEKTLATVQGGKTVAEAIVNNINSGLRNILGFGWEYLIGQKDNIIEKLLGVKVEHYGDTLFNNQAFEYKRATTDVRFKGNLGKIKLEVPLGANIKFVKTNKNANMVHLSVKSGTNLGKMLDILNSTTGFMNAKEYEAFANIAANFRRKSLKSGTVLKDENGKSKGRKDKVYNKTVSQSEKLNFNYANMGGLLPALNKVLMITGLAGSMTSKDISTIFIVNSKILNIIDILQELGKINNWQNIQVAGGLTMGKLERVSEQHHFVTKESGSPNKNDQKTRSDEINEKLRNIDINLKLNLSHSLLKQLSSAKI